MASITLFLKDCVSNFSSWINGGEDYAEMTSERKIFGQFSGAHLDLNRYKITGIRVYGQYKRDNLVFSMGNWYRGATIYNGTSISNPGSAVGSQYDSPNNASTSYKIFTTYSTTDIALISSLATQINNGLVVTINLNSDNYGSTSGLKNYRVWAKNIKLDVTYEEKPQYTLSLSAGTGCASVSGGGTYYQGQTVTITAAPATGYIWSGWSDGNTSQTRSITVNSNLSLTANFTPITYYIVYNANGGSGTINTQVCKYDTSYTLSNCTFTPPTVTLTFSNGVAAQTKNKAFKYWQDDYTNTIYAAGTTIKNLRDTNGYVSQLLAIWDNCSFTLPTPTQEGYQFLYWFDGTNSYNAGDVITLSADYKLTAVWKQIKIEKIYIGNTKATVYVGNTEVKAVYVGNEKIYG